MEIKTIDEYILMEMCNGSGEDVYTRASKCETCEEYIVKKLLEMEDKNEKLEDENWMLADKNKKLEQEITTLKEENATIATLKKENDALRESLKNCGKKITQVTKVLEDGLESRLNNGLEAPAISVKIDFDDYDYLDELDDFDISEVDPDDLNYEDKED